MNVALTRNQVRRLDAIAIEELSIPGIVLMENAGRGAAETILTLLRDTSAGRVVIYCGTGNNGGDGFVIARHLVSAGRETFVRLAAPESAIRGDALVNYRIVRNMGVSVVVLPESNPAAAPTAARAPDLVPMELGRVVIGAAGEIRPDNLIVDALLGTGFQGHVRPPLADLIRAINAAEKRLTVAIDAPSGLDCDTGQPGGVAVRADHTITFVAPKVGFSQPGALEWTGKVWVVGIGTPPELVERVRGEE